MRYYYKALNGKGFLNLKEPLLDTTEYAQLTEQEYNDLTAIKKRLPTDVELARREISNIKRLLASTDYKAIKYAEGLITEQDYKVIKTYRESLREQIRALETQIDKK